MIDKIELIANNHPGAAGSVIAGLSFLSSIITASIPYLQFTLIILGILSTMLAVRRELLNYQERKDKAKDKTKEKETKINHKTK